MFSRISRRMDGIKQVISGEEAGIELASVPSNRKAINAELSNSIESRDKTPERGLEQVTECCCDLDPVLAEYANKYIDKFVSNQTIINEILSFNAMPENLKKGKIYKAEQKFE